MVRILALAAIVAVVSPVVLLGVAPSPASAQEQDRSEGPAQQALEEEDAGQAGEDPGEDAGPAEEVGPAEDAAQPGDATADAEQAQDGGEEDGGEDEAASPWALSVTLNRALLVWEDGRDTHVYSVDNNHDAT